MYVKKGYNPPNKIVVTDEMKRLVKENHGTMTNREIADMLGLQLTTTRKIAYALGLKKMEMEYWPDAAVRFLRLYYKHLGDTEIAEIFTRHFPKQKGWRLKHIEKKRRYLGLKRTDEERKAIFDRNVRLSRFAVCAKKMWLTRGAAPEGDVRVWEVNGLPTAMIKINGGFVHRNRWMYESAFGKLKSNQCVRPKEGSPVICELSDLEVITRSENARLNHYVDTAIVKRKFKIKNTVEAKAFANANPGLVQVQRNIMKLTHKLNEHANKDQ